jgi:N6-adenosine-specific RNA methylase IME4/DNA-binding transcriptional regulator YiaG
MEFKPWPKLKEVLPPLSTYEHLELEASIARHGVLQPILVLPDGRIIDGYHRWQIARDKTPFTTINLDEEAAFLLGLSVNIARRQMSPEQIRKLREKQKEIARGLRKSGLTQEQVATIIGVTQKTIDNWEQDISNSNPSNIYDPPDLRISIPQDLYETIYQKVQAGEPQAKVAAYYKITQPRVSQIVRLVEARRRQPEANVGSPPLPNKQYRCLVIDPPWPVQKIEREERPNQGLFLDYPTMTLEEIASLPVPELAQPDGCHIYLWVTHKYLPSGLELLEQWGISYQCLLTWVKPTGFTPFSWQYNTEHVLFGRIGSLDLLKLGLRLSFEAPVREHSRKPEVFYQIVRQVSPEPRLELFARERRLGFEAWGKEVEKFGHAIS